MNTTTIGVEFLFLIALLLLCGYFLFARRSARRIAASSLPQPRHWMIRWLGGTLAVGLMVALAVGTWRATGPGGEKPDGKILRPSRAVAPLEVKNASRWREVELAPCRLILTFGLVHRQGGTAVPISAESKVIEWPEGRGRMVEIRQSLGGVDYHFELTPTDIFQMEEHGKPVFNLRGRHDRTAQGGGMSRASGGGYSEAIDAVHFEWAHDGERVGNPPMSVLPASREGIWYRTEIARAEAGDPLKEVDLASLAGPMGADDDEFQRTSGRRMLRDAAPGAKMLVYIGPSAALLLLAALAGSQVFRRRGIAFVALLAVMVLFAGTMDRLVWERRARVVTDDTRPELERVATLAKLSSHFFHTGRTIRYLEELQKAKETSRMLRHEAEMARFEIRYRGY